MLILIGCVKSLEAKYVILYVVDARWFRTAGVHGWSHHVCHR